MRVFLFRGQQYGATGGGSEPSLLLELPRALTTHTPGLCTALPRGDLHTLGRDANTALATVRRVRRSVPSHAAQRMACVVKCLDDSSESDDLLPPPRHLQLACSPREASSFVPEKLGSTIVRTVLTFTLWAYHRYHGRLHRCSNRYCTCF